MEPKAIIAFSILIIFAIVVALMIYGHYRIPAKYKIVEVTHANGKIDYTIKTSSFPFYFLWVTVEVSYGYYSVVMRGVGTLEHAKELVEQYKENDRRNLGKRITNRRTVE